MTFYIDEPVDKRKQKRKEANLQKQTKILDLFCIYYHRYTTKKGIPSVYLPTPQDIYLARAVARLHYKIPQWEGFIKLYFSFADQLVEKYGGSVSFSHFLQHFNKLNYLVEDGDGE